MNKLILSVLMAQFVLLIILFLQVLDAKKTISKLSNENKADFIRPEFNQRVRCEVAKNYAKEYRKYMSLIKADSTLENASFKIPKENLSELLGMPINKNLIGVFGRNANTNCVILMPADNNFIRIAYPPSSAGTFPGDVEEMFPEHFKLSVVNYDTLFNCNITLK